MKILPSGRKESSPDSRPQKPTRPTPREIADLVPMATLLRHLGFEVSERTHRARCILCGAQNPTTFSWRDAGQWHCFRCNGGGDRYSLVQAVRGVGFAEARSILAGLAGVQLEADPDLQKRLARRKRAAMRLEVALEKYRALYFEVWRERGDWVRGLERLGDLASERLAQLHAGARARFHGEPEICWGAIGLVCSGIRQAVSAYYLISFGSEDDQQRFVLFPNDRAGLIDSVLARGGFLDDAGRFVEVPF